MSEEDVKIGKLLPFLEAKGYKRSCMDFEVAVEVHEGRKKKTIFADVLVYSSPAKKAPLLLCETKGSSEPLDRSAREQAISYARLLPKIAPLVVLTNGDQTQVYLTVDKVRIPDLPLRNELHSDILKFVISSDAQEALRREAKHELFIIDDVQTFKSILKACHNEIRNNEGLDPTAAFDEMSKVMFCKLYEEKCNPKTNRFRLNVFDDCLDRLHFNVVHNILEEAKKASAYKDVLSEDTRIELKDRTIRKIVELFESYDLGLTAFDVKGEAFEYFLGDTFTGGLGEYFTPRNVVEFMVDAIAPRIGEKIVDPFCGTGGFLIYAFDTVSEKIRAQDFAEGERAKWRLELSEKSLFGIDWKERIAQACKMNMTVHGDGSSGIFKWDGLQDVPDVIGPERFDICLTNPPFGSFENDPVILNKYELGHGRKTQDRLVLGVERCLNLLKPGGRMAIVVIDGVLNNPSTAYVRTLIRDRAVIKGVVSLGKATFQSYGAIAKTSVLFLQKKRTPEDQQESVFFALAENTGLAGNGQAIAGNELPDILVDFKEFLKMGLVTTPKAKTWVAALDDRLDAEAYAQFSVDRSDVAGLRSTFMDALQRSKKAYAKTCEVESQLASMEFEEKSIGDVLEEVKEKAEKLPDVIYRLLGVKWWGDGVFLREQKMGRGISGSLYRVRAGLLIYNRLFAFRGSFAQVPDEFDDAHVSNEFPMFKAREFVSEPDLTIRYLVHVLNSPQTLAVVDRLSTGSTKESRNRFNQTQLMKLRVMVPKRAGDLRRVVLGMDAATTVRREQVAALEIAKLLRNGVLESLPAVIA